MTAADVLTGYTEALDVAGQIRGQLVALQKQVIAKEQAEAGQ